MTPAEPLVRQCPFSFRRGDAGQHAIRIVEGEREEVVPSYRYDGVRLDLAPGDEPEAAAREGDAAEVERERDTAGQQSFRSDESAEREQTDAEPAGDSIDNIRVCMSDIPRSSNKNAAERDEDDLSLR